MVDAAGACLAVLGPGWDLGGGYQEKGRKWTVIHGLRSST